MSPRRLFECDNTGGAGSPLADSSVACVADIGLLNNVLWTLFIEDDCRNARSSSAQPIMEVAAAPPNGLRTIGQRHQDAAARQPSTPGDCHASGGSIEEVLRTRDVVIVVVVTVVVVDVVVVVSCGREVVG